LLLTANVPDSKEYWAELTCSLFCVDLCHNKVFEKKNYIHASKDKIEWLLVTVAEELPHSFINK